MIRRILRSAWFEAIATVAGIAAAAIAVCLVINAFGGLR